MRIVGGRFRAARLAAPRSDAVRPTSDRVRETLFNILEHGFSTVLPGARVLDLFAGTGALGLEALSRGAAFAVFIDTGVEPRGLIRTNIERTGTGGMARVFRRDATRLGSAGTLAPFDLCFADPPYGRGLGEAAFASARAGGWLAAGALCILEEDARAEVATPEGFVLEEMRRIGDTTIRFLRQEAAVDQ